MNGSYGTQFGRVSNKVANCESCGKAFTPTRRDQKLCPKTMACAVKQSVKRRIERGDCKRCASPALSPHKVCERHLYSDRIASKERQRKRLRQRRAEGLCPRCGKLPPTFGYMDCLPCRQAYLDRVAMKKADAREDYESWMRIGSHYTWRETAVKVGLGPTQMMRHIQKGSIYAIKDPWGRLWIRREDRNNFQRYYVRGYPYGSV